MSLWDHGVIKVQVQGVDARSSCASGQSPRHSGAAGSAVPVKQALIQMQPDSAVFLSQPKPKCEALRGVLHTNECFPMCLFYRQGAFEAGYWRPSVQHPRCSRKIHLLSIVLALPLPAVPVRWCINLGSCEPLIIISGISISISIFQTHLSQPWSSRTPIKPLWTFDANHNSGWLYAIPHGQNNPSWKEGYG